MAKKATSRTTTAKQPSESSSSVTTEKVLEDIVAHGKNAHLSEAQSLLKAVAEVRERFKIDATSLEEAAESELNLKPFGGLNILSAYVDYVLDKNGKETDKLGVRLLVSQMPQEFAPGLGTGIEFPTTTSTGVPISLQAIGEIQEQTQPGDSITDTQERGTFGAIVTRHGSVHPNGHHYKFLLSNRHVIASPSNPSLRAPILDSVTRQPIAQLFSWSVHADARVDNALAFINSSNVTPPNRGFQLNPNPIGRAELSQMMQQGSVRVLKFGAESGLTRGIIDGVGVSVNIQGRGTKIDQIQIMGLSNGGQRGTVFSRGGDSGAIVVEESSKRPIGLLFAGRGPLSYVNRIDNVIASLQINSFIG